MWLGLCSREMHFGDCAWYVEEKCIGLLASMIGLCNVEKCILVILLGLYSFEICKLVSMA